MHTVLKAIIFMAFKMPQHSLQRNSGFLHPSHLFLFSAITRGRTTLFLRLIPSVLQFSTPQLLSGFLLYILPPLFPPMFSPWSYLLALQSAQLYVHNSHIKSKEKKKTQNSTSLAPTLSFQITDEPFENKISIIRVSTFVAPIHFSVCSLYAIVLSLRNPFSKKSTSQFIFLE